ncbi:MAG TPA: hypothetical protein VGN83_15840 [Falsiroseomonas sp.]|jgi:hypothetical protein|nr:hypothetical protein [Falsiroseomonas sp.]
MFDPPVPADVAFARLPPHRQVEELERTRRIVAELLREVRGEFPEVNVTFNGEPVADWVVDAAWTFSRAALREARASGKPYDPLAIVAAQMPSAIARDQARIARMEPAPEPHGAGGFHEWKQYRQAGLPRSPLIAPLVLESGEPG